MSLGGIIGAVAGGIIGFFIGGAPGVLYGASIGFSLGMYVDPITPDISATGTPLPDGFEVMLSEIGNPLPDLVGTGKITGRLLCFGKERNVAQTTEVEGGKGGGSPDSYVTGYKYYMSWAVGIVAGPVDTLYAIYKDDDAVVWEGELPIPASGGQETISLAGMGSATFYFGSNDQAANSNVGAIIGDETLNSPYRNFCWCFFDDCCIGEFNRCPTMRFIVGKTPVIAFSGLNVIEIYNYNPIHAMWYTLHDLAGLPETWLHAADFAAAALTLSNESRGICCLFNNQQNVLDYLENFNNHIDGIIRYGSDGKFHPKLIRDDYVVGDLPLIDENVMVEKPDLTRKSWIDTVNEVKVQYSELVGPAANIYNLFGAAENNIVGVHFSGAGLSLIGSYDPVGSIHSLVLRHNSLITVGGVGATAELRRIGTSAVNEELPLLASYPIVNQYDIVLPQMSVLAYNPTEDDIFYVDTEIRVVKFAEYVREARGFYNTVTIGTDGNLYVNDYVYGSWSYRPITDPNWDSFWDLIPDNICDSPITPWEEGSVYRSGSDAVDCVCSSSSLYIVIYGTPYSYLRKFNQSSLDIEASILGSFCRKVVIKGNRVFTLGGVITSTVYAYDADNLTTLGNTVVLSGMMGDIEAVGDYIIVITRPYAGGDSGVFKIDPISLNVVDSLIFSAEEGALLYQTLAKINFTHVAAGRNTGLSVFNTAPLEKVADIELSDFGYSSKATVVL